jgi:transposase
MVAYATSLNSLGARLIQTNNRGRPPKLTKHQRAEALRMLAEFDEEDQPRYTQAAVARLLNVDQSTISRLASRAA